MEKESLVYLEKFTPEDFNKYFRLVGNEKVMAMITERAIPEDEARNDYAKLIQNNALHKTFGNYKIISHKDHSFIGLAKLEIMTPLSKEAELGYMLLPEYWGQGIGSKVAGILIEMGKKEPRLQKITAIIDPENIPSRRILLNHGFISGQACEIDGLPGEILDMRL